MSETSFTGRNRRRQTRLRVRVAERLARVCISVGGVGTILAVTLILVFLTWVVVPLFSGAQLHPAPAAASLEGQRSNDVLHLGIDEYQHLGWVLTRTGILECFRLDTGETLERRSLVPPAAAPGSTAAAPTLTAASFSIQGDEVALGFSDGSVRLGSIGFATEFLDAGAQPELVTALATAPLARRGTALVERISPNQLRSEQLSLTIGEPVATGTAAAVLALDASFTSQASQIFLLDARGELRYVSIERTEDLISGTIEVQTHDWRLPYEPAGAPPEHVLISGGGGTAYAAWRDGHTLRFDTRKPEAAALAQEIDLVDGPGELTALGFVIGKTTLISGDSRGRVRGWFGIKEPGSKACDGVRLVLAHELSPDGEAVRSLAASARNRVIAVGRADGSVSLHHVTSHNHLAQASSPRPGALLALAIAPKADGVLGLGAQGLAHWRMDLASPEASMGALFTPVWYEGYEKPEHVWQSSGGTDDVEPKLGLWPLVFGTLKATFYSMLFGAPLALLAALFTSEFLSPRLRTPLKSLTELMASLPSVVLGFLAGLIIAPFVQQHLASVMALIVCLPLALLCGAYTWQLLPPNVTLRHSGWPRFVAIGAMLPIGTAFALLVGPLLERILFAGNAEAWLAGGIGSGVGGWMLLLLPVSLVLVLLGLTRWVNPWIRRRSAAWSRARSARVDFLKFALAALAVVVLDLVIAWALDGLWIDPRGGVLDTFDQHNALIVGFVMGFAIIPIIYTLAEDALSSVPKHLRLASMGAGATPWQTAMRVVVPTAMSGIFSAVMIGLGRAVGETMIVLMAAGNTPVRSWNVFNGMRTLSATIATELPEAVKNSPHYRTLFVAALCLFALTFVLNTIAELVRQRFRKRAYQL